MSVQRQQLEARLIQNLPKEVIVSLLNEYQNIKQQFVLKKFRPTELNAARFSESVLRLLEYLDTGSFTPFGQSLRSINIINRVGNNVTLSESIRFFIPQLIKVLLDVRNRRDVAHTGGEVNPNYSDSLLVTHCTDWILIEIIRNYDTNDIELAKQIVTSINETKIPIIAEVDGYVRIQNTGLKADQKTLLILYHRQPEKIKDVDLAKWIQYSNISRYRTQLLKNLHKEALIHYLNNYCVLLPKGIQYVEQNIELHLVV